MNYQDWSIKNGSYDYPGGLAHMAELVPERFSAYVQAEADRLEPDGLDSKVSAKARRLYAECLCTKSYAQCIADAQAITSK